MELFEYEAELEASGCRDYQKRSIIGAFNCWDTASSTLINLATGLGKTFCGVTICDLWEKHKDGRILWIAHRKELIEQAAATIARLTGQYPETEMGEQRANSYGLLADSNIVVASIQTLNAGYKCSRCDGTGGILTECPDCSGEGEGCQNQLCEQRGTVPSDIDCPFCLGGKVRRVQKFKPSEFGLIVTDECHHASSSSYRRVQKWFNKNPHNKLLGLTATVDRSDGTAIGPIFQTTAISIGLCEGIDLGWLVPITQQAVSCEHMDFSHIRTNRDFNDKNIEEVLIAEETLHEMVAPTVEVAEDRRTLVFCVDKTHTKKVCELINRYKPGSARYVLGCTSEDVRAKNFTDHKNGVFQFLVNCGVTTEGYDDPGIQVVAVMRPTKSRPLYEQMIGRGTRPLTAPTELTPEERKAAIAAGPKTGCLILDFVGNSGRHKLVTTLDLFDGKYPQPLIDRAKRIKEETEEELPTEELLRRAQEQIDEEEKRQKEEAEAKRLEFLKAKEAKYRLESIDPFAWWDVLPQRMSAEKRGEPASDAQTGALMKMGVEPFKLQNISKSQASVMLESLAERKQKGLASYKQARLLRRNGMSADVSFAQARKIIDTLAANHWRMTDAIRSMAPLQGSTEG